MVFVESLFLVWVQSRLLWREVGSAVVADLVVWAVENVA